MAWEIEHFKGKDFASNPQNINRKWRPRKGISAVTAELAEKGFSPATSQEIKDNYMAMLQLSQDDLELLKEDRTKPALINILARNMLSERGFDIAERMIDRGHGKAVQQVESKQELDVSVSDADIKSMSLDELTAYINSKTK